MTVLTLEEPRRVRTPTTEEPEARKDTRVYAIAFDMDTDTLQKSYGSDSWRNAYTDIRKRLESHGFSRQQGSVYYGDMNRVTAVSCVLAAMDLSRTFSWFAASVRDIRM